jgi:hypothetical protein
MKNFSPLLMAGGNAPKILKRVVEDSRIIDRVSYTYLCKHPVT